MQFQKEIKKRDNVSILVPTTFLSFGETCQYLDLSENQLRGLISNKSIPYFKTGGNFIYFDVNDLLKWITKGYVKSITEIETELPKQMPNAPLTAAAVFGD